MAERYQILEPLGKGAMGEILLARDSLLERRVALKFLPAELQEDEAARSRFLREARLAAALDHPYICKVYEIGRMDGRDFIALEYVEGKTLKQRIEEGPIDSKQALEIAGEIAEALEKAHGEKVIHRDLKPSNVMLTAEGHVKVMDFGLAKRLPSDEGSSSQDQSASWTGGGGTPGTPAYMSPEQLRGEAADTRSDIFSFGILLYEMLAGVHPFRKAQAIETAHAILSEAAPRLSDYLPQAPPLLQHAVQKMLAREPQRRYRDMGQARADLREIGLELESPLEAAAAPFEQKRERSRFLRQALPWVVAVLAVLAVVTWQYLQLAPRLPQPTTRFRLPTEALAVLVHASSPAVALSPDGTHLAYIAGDSQFGQLYVRDLNSLAAKPVFL